MKRKVGILTFHRANNYGAVLQCYALQEIIKALGYNVEIINYRQPYIEELYKPITINDLCRVLKKPRWYFGYFFKVIPKKTHTHIKYKTFREQHLNMSAVFDKKKDVLNEYDTIIIGSDQVWGLHCTNGVDEVFFGEFPKKKNKVIGYGISGNIKSLKEIGAKNLRKYYNNFNAISFREDSFQSYIKELVGVESEVVIDPTMLLEKEKWECIASKIKEKGNYILTYFLQGVKNSSKLNEDLKHFAKRENCKLVNIFDVAYSPTEFLGWIKNAKYIFTTSFHATVFSIIFNKEVYALRTHNGHDARYVNLLSKLDISDRAIEADDIINMEINTTDYVRVNSRHLELKKGSIEFLINNLRHL